MANNYSSASFAIPVKDGELTLKRLEAIEAFVTSDDDTDDDAAATLPADRFGEKAGTVADALRGRRIEQQYLGFDWSVAGGALYLSHDETIDMEAAVLVAQIVLDLDDNDSVFSTTWADTCSSARVDEFGGGAVAFNRHQAEWKTTYELTGELTAKLQATPPVDPDPDVNWRNDAIQFPRLLAEIAAVVQLTDAQWAALSATTDLNGTQLADIFTRAVETWDAIKARTTPQGGK